VHGKRYGFRSFGAWEVLYKRYGFDLDVLWPRLEALLREESAERVASARNAAQRAVSVTTGWVFGALCAWISSVLYFRASPLLVVLVVGSLLAAAQAWPQAKRLLGAYSEAVVTAVDLHRLLLFDAAGWRRPQSAEEERAMFAALARGTGDDDQFRIVRLSEAEDVVEVVKRSVGPAVKQSIREAIAGPAFANFDGVVGARLVAGDDSPEVEIFVGADAPSDTQTARLRVRGGAEAAAVPFTVRVESNAQGFHPFLAQIEVPQDGHPPEVVSVPLDPSPDQELWVWVRVLQHDRTLQNLELTSAGAGINRGMAAT
jgi:hypothetical protein